MIQYRGQLMPLVTIDASVRVRSEGAQPLLVFSDGARSMALVVDEIVDIVEDRLDIEVAGGGDGVLGSAIIKGQATEIIDVGHFLPLAFEDWFRRKEQKVAARRRAVLLVDDSPFFRNMLAPVLQAAGFDVVSVGSAAEALAHVDGGRAVDIVITDIEMPDMDGFAFTEALRRHPRGAELPVIGLSSIVSAEAIERGRQGRLPRLRRQVRPPGLDRGAEGTERIRAGGMSGETGTLHEYVTAQIGGQLIGLPILRVQDVFVPEGLTRVPLAPPEIAGVLNLRGRIVTVIDMRRRLGLEAGGAAEAPLAIGVELRGESYGLLIDAIGEVLKLDADAREPNPLNLDPRLARVSTGIHRLNERLLMMIDVDRVLDIAVESMAA